MIARTMKFQLTFIFCIFALYQVNSFEIVVQIDRFVGNTYIPFIVKQNSTGGNWDKSTYELTFIREVSVENDMIIKYSYVDVSNEQDVEEGEVPFCGVDPDSTDGGSVAFIARAMGISEKLCPIANGTKFTQEEMFAIDSKEYPKVKFSKIASSYNTYLTAMVDKYEFIRIYVHVDDNIDK